MLQEEVHFKSRKVRVSSSKRSRHGKAKPRYSSAQRHFQNFRASSWNISRRKRILDISIALPVLVIFSVPMLILGLCVRLTSKGNAIFVQERIGYRGRRFHLYKFRSMTTAPIENAGPGLTRGGDRRVTTLGRWMRKFKADELPQFFNVLIGDMSLVGPRPKLPKYAVIKNLPCRPGITGAATLAFRREEELLRHFRDADEMEQFYVARIKPLKARIDARYMRNATFTSDMKVIGATFLACVAPSRVMAVGISSLKSWSPSE